MTGLLNAYQPAHERPTLLARVTSNAAIGLFAVVAAWFAIIHFRPVEYPGLFTFGLVTGACLLLTDRLGMSWATHIAFNATGLLLAVR